MAGIMKRSGPNTSSAAAEASTPMMAGRCRRSPIHWSRKMTRNSAVSTNSMPLVENGSSPPTSQPNAVPTIQYQRLSTET